MNQGALSFLAYDVMETHCGEWLDWHRIIGEVARIRGLPASDVEAAVRRAIWRMLDHGTIESKHVVGAGQATHLMFRVATRDYWHEEATA